MLVVCYVHGEITAIAFEISTNLLTTRILIFCKLGGEEGQKPEVSWITCSSGNNRQSVNPNNNY